MIGVRRPTRPPVGLWLALLVVFGLAWDARPVGAQSVREVFQKVAARR